MLHQCEMAGGWGQGRPATAGAATRAAATSGGLVGVAAAAQCGVWQTSKSEVMYSRNSWFIEQQEPTTATGSRWSQMNVLPATSPRALPPAAW